MGNRKGVRCLRKGPEMWPARFHEAIREAVMYDSARVELYPTKAAAEAAARSMRLLWRRIRETPLHPSAVLLEEVTLKLALRGMTSIGATDWWELTVVRSPNKNFIIKD